MKVIISEVAADQLREIHAVLRERSQEAARRFTAYVRNAVRRLGQYPQSGRAVGDVRRVVLRRYQYLMLYQILDEHVYITKLVHQKQDVDYGRTDD